MNLTTMKNSRIYLTEVYLYFKYRAWEKFGVGKFDKFDKWDLIRHIFLANICKYNEITGDLPVDSPKFSMQFASPLVIRLKLTFQNFPYMVFYSQS